MERKQSLWHMFVQGKEEKGIPGNQDRETVSAGKIRVRLEERLEPAQRQKNNQSSATMSDAVKSPGGGGGEGPDHFLDVEMRGSPLVVSSMFRGNDAGRDRLHSGSLRKGAIIGHLLTAQQQHDTVRYQSSISTGSSLQYRWLTA